MDLLTQLLNATLTIGGASILWREIIGNAFGLASAFGGMRRMVWAWPIGIVGTALLFTVFLGVADTVHKIGMQIACHRAVILCLLKSAA